MTIKVSDIVTDALEDLIVQAAEAEIIPTEARAAIRTLNDMMAAWDAEGIHLGYTMVNSMDDIMTVPYGSILGIKANLAISLAPKYNVQIPMSLHQRAKAGYQACLALGIQLGESAYPSTLPQGGANNYPSYNDQTFYPDRQNTILNETGGSIALEEDT